MRPCASIDAERRRSSGPHPTRPTRAIRPVRQTRRASHYEQRHDRAQRAPALYESVYDVPEDDDGRTLYAGAVVSGAESSGEDDGYVQSSGGVADADGADEAVDERDTDALLPVTSVDPIGSVEAIAPTEDVMPFEDAMLMGDMAGVDTALEEMGEGDFLAAIEGMEGDSVPSADGDISMIDQMVQLQLGEQTKTSHWPAQQEHPARRSPAPAERAASSEARYIILARMEAAARRQRRWLYGWY